MVDEIEKVSLKVLWVGIVLLLVSCGVVYCWGHHVGERDEYRRCHRINVDGTKALLDYGVVPDEVIYGNQNLYRVPMTGAYLFEGDSSLPVDDERSRDRVVILGQDFNQSVKTYCTVVYPAHTLGKSVCFHNTFYRDFEFENDLEICQGTWKEMYLLMEEAERSD